MGFLKRTYTKEVQDNGRKNKNKTKNNKMTLKILKEKENPLFNRREISFEISAEITPSHKEILDLMSKKLSVPEENIKIKKIRGRFGSKEFVIDANIYASKNHKEGMEKKSKKKAEVNKE